MLRMRRRLISPNERVVLALLNIDIDMLRVQEARWSCFDWPNSVIYVIRRKHSARYAGMACVCGVSRLSITFKCIHPRTTICVDV